MAIQSLINFEPQELRFPVELNQQLYCSIKLSNNSDGPVAFKLLSTNPRDYGVRPRIGVLPPRSTCDVAVTKGGMKKVPHGMRCKDKFKIQSIALSPGAITDDVKNLFNEVGHVFEEHRLRVVYITPPPIADIGDESSYEESTNENPNSVFEVMDSGGVEPRDVALQENGGENVWKSVIRGIVVCFGLVVSLYLMKSTLSLIWSLTVVGSMLIIKMIKKLVSESVEDWIGKTVLYLLMHLLFKRKNNNSSKD